MSNAVLNDFLCPPVLLIAFNRPDNTQKVFDAIAKEKPARFFLAVDGPREGREDDLKNTNLVKQLIKKINWPCEVKTLFSEKNLGCKLAVVGAINWFFEHVDSGIILEDDCVPSHDFFDFCDLMLNRYANDSKVMLISGTNFYAEQKKFGMEKGAFFSKYFTMWGWATWRRAWAQYDLTLESVPKKKLAQELRQAFRSSWISFFYLQIYREAKNSDFSTWDFQWSFKMLVSEAFAVAPASNLITNIGIEGFHASASSPDARFLNLKTQTLDVSRISDDLKEEPEYHRTLVADIFSDISKLKLCIRALLTFTGMGQLIFKWRRRKRSKK